MIRTLENMDEDSTGWRKVCNVDLYFTDDFLEVRIDDLHIEEANAFVENMKHTLIKDGVVELCSYYGFRCQLGCVYQVLNFFSMFVHRNKEHMGFHINILKAHLDFKPHI
jgi:hypothetical protein